MAILVLNSGSSSIKFSLYEPGSGSTPQCVFDAEIVDIGHTEAKLHIKNAGATSIRPEDLRYATQNPEQAIDAVFRILTLPTIPRLEAVGYRVVHPGTKISDHTRITQEVLDDIKETAAFAPLHEPATLKLIQAGRAAFPSISHYACFDAVFHKTMPEEAFTYAIPLSFRHQGIRRYGFHGLSCESVLVQLRSNGGSIPQRMVIAHLGSGCSVTALQAGQSIDNTMGLTPTGGVVMGTRPGDLDPGVLLYLLRQQSGSAQQAASKVEAMLNQDAGVAALSALPNDMILIRKAAADGNEQAALALRVFTRSITKAIGAYCFLLGGLDAIVFTGGIGEHDAQTRAEVLAHLAALDIAVDGTRNQEKTPAIRLIHSRGYKTQIYVIPAQEDLMIAVHVMRMAASQS